jgi:hypothetical protein
MKSIRKLVVALVVVMAAALVVIPTFAQDNPATPTAPTTDNSGTHNRPSGTGIGSHISSLTLTITQEQINNRLANRKGDRLQDLSVVLGDNQITVSFTTKGDKNSDEGKAVVAVVTPAAADGKVSWTLDSLTISGTAATQDQKDMLKERVTSLIGKFDQRERRFSVSSITVDSSAINIILTRNPNS